MKGRWVKDCQKILNEIKNSSKVECSDTLDIVQTIRFTILVLQQNMTGRRSGLTIPTIWTKFPKTSWR